MGGNLGDRPRRTSGGGRPAADAGDTAGGQSTGAATLGPSHLRNFPAYEGFAASPAVMNTVRWPGNHVVGEDPLVDQFMANEVSNVSDEAYHSELSEKGAVELLDRIGPSIVLTHAFGGFLGWIMADRRPNLVKGILAMEINGNPFLNQLRWGVTAIPLAYDPPAASRSR